MMPETLDVDEQPIWEFLVCFQARGAPGEGQGDPGARRRPEDPEKLLKPMGDVRKLSSEGRLKRKFSYGPIWTIEQMRNCHMASQHAAWEFLF